jgi:hypothetical protein
MIRDMRLMVIPMKNISAGSMATEAITAGTTTAMTMLWMINITPVIHTLIARRFIPTLGAGGGTVLITAAIHATIFGLDIHTAADGDMAILMVGAMMVGIVTGRPGMILFLLAMVDTAVTDMGVMEDMVVTADGVIPGMAIPAMDGEHHGMDMEERIIDPIGIIRTTVMVVDTELFTVREW